MVYGCWRGQTPLTALQLLLATRFTFAYRPGCAAARAFALQDAATHRGKGWERCGFWLGVQSCCHDVNSSRTSYLSRTCVSVRLKQADPEQINFWKIENFKEFLKEFLALKLREIRLVFGRTLIMQKIEFYPIQLVINIDIRCDVLSIECKEPHLSVNSILIKYDR